MSGLNLRGKKNELQSTKLVNVVACQEFSAQRSDGYTPYPQTQCQVHVDTVPKNGVSHVGSTRVQAYATSVTTTASLELPVGARCAIIIQS